MGPSPDRKRHLLASNHPGLDGQTGGFTSRMPAPERARQRSGTCPNWWTNGPNPQWDEGSYQGAKTVSRWRQAYLNDCITRLRRILT
jgi:hypothetical protein